MLDLIALSLIMANSSDNAGGCESFALPTPRSLCDAAIASTKYARSALLAMDRSECSGRISPLGKES